MIINGKTIITTQGVLGTLAYHNDSRRVVLDSLVAFGSVKSPRDHQVALNWLENIFKHVTKRLTKNPVGFAITKTNSAFVVCPRGYVRTHGGHVATIELRYYNTVEPAIPGEGLLLALIPLDEAMSKDVWRWIVFEGAFVDHEKQQRPLDSLSDAFQELSPLIALMVIRTGKSPTMVRKVILDMLVFGYKDALGRTIDNNWMSTDGQELFYVIHPGRGGSNEQIVSVFVVLGGVLLNLRSVMISNLSRAIESFAETATKPNRVVPPRRHEITYRYLSAADVQYQWSINDAAAPKKLAKAWSDGFDFNYALGPSDDETRKAFLLGNTSTKPADPFFTSGTLQDLSKAFSMKLGVSQEYCGAVLWDLFQSNSQVVLDVMENMITSGEGTPVFSLRKVPCIRSGVDSIAMMLCNKSNNIHVNLLVGVIPVADIENWILTFAAKESNNIDPDEEEYWIIKVDFGGKVQNVAAKGLAKDIIERAASWLRGESNFYYSHVVPEEFGNKQLIIREFGGYFNRTNVKDVTVETCEKLVVNKETKRVVRTFKDSSK